jgi:hypothetical protein
VKRDALLLVLNEDQRHRRGDSAARNAREQRKVALRVPSQEEGLFRELPRDPGGDRPQAGRRLPGVRIRASLGSARVRSVSPVQDDAQAFWLREPGHGEIRPVTLPEPGRDDVMVRTLRSGVSRGTETLVFRGGVPPGQYAAMRAPFQEGEFPGPVKYGYLNVGAVEQGPPQLRGRTVFCLYPHQTAYVVPAGAVTVVPEDVPPARAVLAGTVETAVNALWDAAPLVGDRIAVVGAGMVGSPARAPADVDVTVGLRDWLDTSASSPKNARRPDPDDRPTLVTTRPSSAHHRAR